MARGHRSASHRAAFVAAAVAALATVVALSGCAGRRQGESESAVAATEPLHIAVANRYALDVVVYAIINGQRRRLGVVTAATSGSFRLPRSSFAGGAPLRLLADPVGRSDGITSENIVVQPGQSVEWMLESDLRRSTMVVR